METGITTETGTNGIVTQTENTDINTPLTIDRMRQIVREATLTTSTVEAISPEVEADRKEQRITRFKDAPWMSLGQQSITIGGTGGIGGGVCLHLSRIGYKLDIYEVDSVEEVNVNVQFFKSGQVGMGKVDAVIANCIDFSGNRDIYTKKGKFDKYSDIQSICISCFDNMEARRNMFNVWKEEALVNDQTPCVFIDGRLLYGNIQVFVVTKDCIDMYEKELFEDGEVPAESCTLKITSHYAAIIGGIMVSMLTNYLTNFKEKCEILPLPFAYKQEMTTLTTEIIWKK